VVQQQSRLAPAATAVLDQQAVRAKQPSHLGDVLTQDR
jgi:hypothetical protein